MKHDLTASDILPANAADAICVGRVWRDGPMAGPHIVKIDGDVLVDVSQLAPTMSDLLEIPDVVNELRRYKGEQIMSLQSALNLNLLLAPPDLQAIKASGVTFADSALERVIEESVYGEPENAGEVRARIAATLGGSLKGVKPGSEEAAKLKSVLINEGMWSQYLEVAIGPDPEIFTKCQPLASVGCGAEIGVHPNSAWNNPEAEIVLAVTSSGAIVGASLGNDVNLRDFEGRSALLLGLAKDNNASCAIGPFIRLFDENFTLNDIRQAEVNVTISGEDGFSESGSTSMSDISRDPELLVRAAINDNHRFPDGMLLFLGTMFTPRKNRNGEFGGFTHKPGDIVTIRSKNLGALVNPVTTSDRAMPWRFGMRCLMRSLSARDLI